MKKFVFSVLSAGLVTTFMPACTKGGAKGGGDITITIGYEKGDAVAEVGGKILTVKSLGDDFMARQGQFKGAPHLNTDQKRTEFVENQVVQEAMFLEAVEEGYFKNPEVLRDIKKIVVQRLMRDKLAQAQNEVPVSEEQMKEHYDNNKNLYNRGEAVKVSYLEIPFGPDKKKTKDIANAMQKDAVKTVKNANMNDFSRVAMKHIKPAGDGAPLQVQTITTGYLEQAEFDQKFGKDAFMAMKTVENIGDISSLKEGEKSFFIFMKTGYRKELNEPFEDAKSKIEKRLSFENRSKSYEKYVSSLHEKYKIKIIREKIAELGKDHKIDNAIQKKENVATNEAHDEATK